MIDGQIDKAKYYASTSLQGFSQEWKKISSFAFSSKHDLLQVIQMTYELQ